ncbi:unnamed protein product [Didymodactylos carnosus]|uniref:Uncharacterized protein n=1 Tax=Didymodactylos carnosus TaxID=1234261 RepID=A0A815JY23_9BILA|nr:unnamed protein product [Didymodactylos carnosus]CAF1388317.1 unnamed protein product [Didymodactylos carnosus]CAF4025658.1 unnamed protein product [Didymodactylos carnosus]CAF4283058.1 unnamed protein product [Didymodactylos carnosus]
MAKSLMRELRKLLKITIIVFRESILFFSDLILRQFLSSNGFWNKVVLTDSNILLFVYTTILLIISFTSLYCSDAFFDNAMLASFSGSKLDEQLVYITLSTFSAVISVISFFKLKLPKWNMSIYNRLQKILHISISLLPLILPFWNASNAYNSTLTKDRRNSISLQVNILMFIFLTIGILCLMILIYFFSRFRIPRRICLILIYLFIFSLLYFIYSYSQSWKINLRRINTGSLHYLDRNRMNPHCQISDHLHFDDFMPTGLNFILIDVFISYCSLVSLISANKENQFKQFYMEKSTFFSYIMIHKVG